MAPGGILDLYRRGPLSLDGKCAPGAADLGLSLLWLAAGGATYGATLGLWNSAQLALFTAIKLPLLWVVTALVAGFASSLFAARLGFLGDARAMPHALCSGFAWVGIVLASVAPPIALFGLTLPARGAPGERRVHAFLALMHVAAIAIAGQVAVRGQRRWLAPFCAEESAARRIVWTWMALHLIVGAQVAWILRPWFGTPGLPVEFLREDAFDGSFYESLWRVFARL